MKLHLLYILLATLFHFIITQSLLNSLLSNLKLVNYKGLTTQSNMDYINQLLQINKDTNQQARVAVEAFSKSVSTCVANVSCDQANRNFNQVQSNLNVASSAYNSSGNNSNRAGSVMNMAQGLINTIRSNMNNDLVNYFQGSINNSVRTTGIAVNATAQALTHCELIVNITCSTCSQGNIFTMDYPQTSTLMDQINANFQSIFN